MMKSFEVIVKALKAQRGYKNGEPELKKIIMGMQGLHLEERKRDLHKIHHSLYTLSGAGVGKLGKFTSLYNLILAEIKVQVE